MHRSWPSEPRGLAPAAQPWVGARHPLSRGLGMQDERAVAYLARIGYTGALQPSAESLRALHLAHLCAVPFENLDISHARPIVLDEALIFDKIVGRGRGGFCYELNGLFAALLRRLGFAVTLLSARVARGDGTWGPEFDHLALRVELEQRWLVDVGFGDCFRQPLLLDGADEAVEGTRAYRVDGDGDERTLWQRDADWQPQYRLRLIPRVLDDFSDMCRYHQISPESPFARRRVCTRATADGRISLINGRLTVTRDGHREEHDVADERAVLRERFGVHLEDNA